jgi:hypothetical protein
VLQLTSNIVFESSHPCHFSCCLCDLQAVALCSFARAQLASVPTFPNNLVVFPDRDFVTIGKPVDVFDSAPSLHGLGADCFTSACVELLCAPRYQRALTTKLAKSSTLKSSARCQAQTWSSLLAKPGALVTEAAASSQRSTTQEVISSAVYTCNVAVQQSQRSLMHEALSCTQCLVC